MALWTPALITTALWLDAADSDTITLVSGNVSQWDDKSGNARHATQATAVSRPEYDSANKRVAFDRANADFMNLASQPFSGTTPRTVIALVENSTYPGGGGGGYFGATSAPTKTGGYWNLCIESTGVFIRIASGNDFFTPIVENNEKTILVTQWESGSSSNSSVWSNGSVLSRAGGTSREINTLSGTAKIGATLGHTEEFFDGYMYEIIVVAGTLSTGNLQTIEGYLAWKWGLEANLPVGHPYEDAAPTIYTAEPFRLRHNPRTNKVIPMLSFPTVTDIGANCVRPRVTKGY